MRTITMGTGAVLLVLAPLAAQDDYRHVDEGRPLRVEDAYPIKLWEWEWEVGGAFDVIEGGTYGAVGVLELKVGVLRNVQVGVELHPEWSRSSGVSEAGVEAFGGHVLFNLNQEGPNVPAFGLRADIATPGVGGAGRDAVGGRIRGLMTRSIGGFRAHVNAAYTWATPADGGDFWSGGVAVDRALGLSSRLLMADLYLEVPRGPGDARVWIDVGGRLQIAKSVVFDAGVFTRLDEWGDGNPNLGLTIGLSRSFGFPGLVRVPPYPNPRID